MGHGNVRQVRRCIIVAVVGCLAAGSVATPAFSAPPSGCTNTDGCWSVNKAGNPSARYASAMAGDRLLFGGSSGTTDLGDTWLYIYDGWTKASPGPSPSPRHGHVMRTVFLAAPGGGTLSQTVLFGGANSSGYLADTWVFGGVPSPTPSDQWAEVTPATSPPGREFASSGNDGNNDNWVLFGGRNASGSLNDTWVWDGSTWRQKFPATSPPPRHGAFMGGISSTGKVVLFGGQSASGAVLGDTWLWDGTTWTEQPASAGDAPARYGAAAGGRSSADMIGGNSGSQLLADHWRYDGTKWVKRSPTKIPSAREFAAGGDGELFGGRARSALSDHWTLVFPRPEPH